MGSNVYVVGKTHHILPTCPCPACVKERRRQGLQSDLTDSRLITMPPRVAYLFKYIDRLCPQGSVARQIDSARRFLGNL